MKQLIEILAGSELENYQLPDPGHLRLSRLNIFIGANNSGKSRLLRLLFSKSDNITSRDIPFDALCVAPNFFRTLNAFEEFDLIDFHHGSITSQPSSTLLKLLNRSDPIPYSEALTLLSSVHGTLNAIISAPELLRFHDGIEFQKEKFLSKCDEAILANERDAVEKYLERARQHKFQRYYIPVLRGLRPTHDSSLDFYKNRTIKDYFSGGGEGFSLETSSQHQIITGLEFYESLKQHLLGKPEKRKRIAEYQKLLSKEFFDSREVTLIPEHDNDVVSVMIENEQQRPIFELGDGLQQIIIITFTAFMSDEPSLIFIEEPEINLHPGLQRRLAEFLHKQTPHQYCITTHSNHFLDVADTQDSVKIYKVTKRLADTIYFEIAPCDSDRSLLHELGVKPSSIYLANSTIWVEGITDRLYLQQYLSKYLKELNDDHKDAKLFRSFKENNHYAFIEYQGGNLVHWDFESSEVNPEDPKLHAVKVAAHGILIADNDVKGKANREEWLTTQLGDRVIFTVGKEIDNMLPLTILKSTVKDVFSNKKESPLKKKTHIELIDTFNDKYQKSEKGIGFLIDKQLKVDAAIDGRLFAEQSGTIKDKVKFCECAIKHMKEDEWALTDDLRTMCEKIFRHIQLCNS